MAADAEVERQLRRVGLNPMDPLEAVAALVDAIGAGGGPVTVADVTWQQFVEVFAAARARPLFADLPQLRQLPPATEETTGPLLAERLAGRGRAEQDRITLELVRAGIAGVLGHTDGGAIEPGQAFKELGFDSLTAVDLRNRLARATGLRVATTVVFDYPNALELAEHLRSQLVPDLPDPAFEGDDEAIRSRLAGIPIDRLREAGLLDPLLRLAGTSTTPHITPDSTEAGGSIDGMDVDALIGLALGGADS